MTFAPNEDKQH